jgi:hypothetical protein
MYESAEDMKRAAYGNGGAQQYSGLGSLVGANQAVAGKPPAAEQLIRELGALMEKAMQVKLRQQNLKDRIFGPSPECSAQGKEAPAPIGFLHEANYRIHVLHDLLDQISGNCTDLERLA